MRALAVIMLVLTATSARATNWEGHEDFFMEKVPLPELTESVPQPILKPLPDCAEVARIAKANPYEQDPIPGKNCKPESGGDFSDMP